MRKAKAVSHHQTILFKLNHVNFLCKSEVVFRACFVISKLHKYRRIRSGTAEDYNCV